MDYWHEIVKSYDGSKSNGSRNKDHGTLSQKIAIVLLTYLAFGTDYSVGITKYFIELRNREIEKHCPSVLMQPNKISSVLKKMNEDKLVTLSKKVSVGAGTRSYYVLNPQIIQSPIRDSTTYIKCDGSPFKIPLETIEDFLGELAIEQAGMANKSQEELRQERHERSDEILERLFVEKVDYFSFLHIVGYEAMKWGSHRKSSNTQPALDTLIYDYAREFEPTRPTIYSGKMRKPNLI